MAGCVAGEGAAGGEVVDLLDVNVQDDGGPCGGDERHEGEGSRPGALGLPDAVVRGRQEERGHPRSVPPLTV